MLNLLIILSEYVTTFLFPLGQFARVSFFNQQINIYPYEVVMAVALVLLIIKHKISPFKCGVTFKSIYLFLTILLVSFLFSFRAFDMYENGIGFLYLLRLTFYFFHFVYLAVHLRKFKKESNHLLKELSLLVFVVILTSWLQYIFYPNLRNLLYQGWDPHLYRVFGAFFEPYLAGAVLGLCFFFVYFRMFSKKAQIFIKCSILGILFLLLMLTFSRTVYVAIILSLITLFFRQKKYTFIGLTVSAFIILAIFIPKPIGVGVQLFRTFSVDTRISNAVEGVQIWMKNPFLGVGYNRIRYKKAGLGLTGKYDLSHAAASYHSSFVTILVAGGALGLLGFLGVLVMLVKISLPSFSYILFLSILSCGDNALLHPFILYVLLKLLAYEYSQSSLE
ncbi:hypothetical protein HZC27_06305 [Candidatus Roizmanbacteria bacterium]|nr:hypothetical protein [Candidatus Roizmanbacteria bacterium]